MEKLKIPFSLGRMLITQNAKNVLNEFDVNDALIRHQNCDWGDCSDSDWETNNNALRNGLRLFSAYKDRFGEKFWLITEADRSRTIVLLPKDY